MSETATETPAATPAPTLPELLRATIANASIPLTVKELAKALPRPKKVKADEFENSLPGYLTDDLQSGRVFKAASGKAGLERYWSRDEKSSIQEAVRTAATEPKKLGELKKLATGLTKADKSFAENIVDEMVATKLLHEHPGKGPLYGRDEAISPNNKEKVSAAILAAAANPTKLAEIIKVAQKETKADKEFVTTVANELVQGKQLHQHPGKGPLYGRDLPISPNNKEKVSAAILAASDPPAKLADILKAAQKATGADQLFVAETANQLISTERLHKQSEAKTAPYGHVKPKPPHPLETGTGKKEFDKLANAADKLLASLAGVTVEELLTRLRDFLTSEKPKPTPEITLTPTATTLVAGTGGTHQPESVAVALSPERIRDGLKTAYDDLCLDPDFEDKLVEIRRLYHDAKRNFPTLTVPQFHAELLHLQSQRAVELQPLNEVQRAKEPELAIHRNDRLLYYVIWK